MTNFIETAPQAIVADGGIITKSGGLLLALAADNFSVIFIVISGLYKLTPEYAFEQDTFNEIIPPN
jgi:translation initiation factor eIF-2B subunit beta